MKTSKSNCYFIPTETGSSPIISLSSKYILLPYFLVYCYWKLNKHCFVYPLSQAFLSGKQATAAQQRRRVPSRCCLQWSQFVWSAQPAGCHEGDCLQWRLPLQTHHLHSGQCLVALHALMKQHGPCNHSWLLTTSKMLTGL